MSKSPFNLAGMSTNINLNRLGGNFRFGRGTSAERRSRMGASILANRARMQKGEAYKGFFNTGGPFGAFFGSQRQPQPNNQEVPEENTSAGAIGSIGTSIGRGFVNLPGGIGDAVREQTNQVAGRVADQVQAAGSMPEDPSSLINPFGLGAQNAIGGTFGSLFDRQNSMGSALQKRACKYKNKK
tara:strand:+ start:294 stop:845 length:552 start_codon:yes stop_codon:yes gene_type:complete